MTFYKKRPFFVNLSPGLPALCLYEADTVLDAGVLVVSHKQIRPAPWLRQPGSVVWEGVCKQMKTTQMRTSKNYLVTVYYDKGVSYHHLRFVGDSKAGRGDGELHGGRKERHQGRCCGKAVGGLTRSEVSSVTR